MYANMPLTYSTFKTALPILQQRQTFSPAMSPKRNKHSEETTLLSTVYPDTLAASIRWKELGNSFCLF